MTYIVAGVRLTLHKQGKGCNLDDARSREVHDDRATAERAAKRYCVRCFGPARPSVYRLEAGRPLAPRQLAALRAYALIGDQRAAAAEMGIRLQTFKNYMTRAFARLGVAGSLSAYRRLGWLVVPE